MPYGTIKIDTVTFTDAGVDKSVTLSGLVQNPTFSGNVTVTGTLSGVTVTGTTANFTSGKFTNISGGTHTITSGVFAAGSAASPSITFTGDLNTGIYSPGADQLALATNGTRRLLIDSNGTTHIEAAAGVDFSVGGTDRWGVNAGIDYVLSTSADSGTTYTERYRQTPAGAVTIQRTASSAGWALLAKSSGVSNDSGFYIDASNNVECVIRSGSNDLSYIKNTGTGSSTGNLIFAPNGTERLRITSDGKVGVGTSAPRSTLNLNATNGAILTLENPSDANVSGNYLGRLQYYGNDVSPSSAGVRASIDALTTDTGGSTSLVFSTTGFVDTTLYERLRITSAGNVGIGTTSPLDTLNVSDGTATFQLKPIGGSSVGYFGMRTNHALAFSTNDTERARIDTSGRLLVGTSTSRGAGLRFQLEGTDFAGSSAQFTRNENNGVSSVIQFLKTRGGSNGSFTTVADGDRLGRLEFQGADGTSAIIAAQIEAFVDGTPGTNDMPGRLVFSTTADGASSPTERMRIVSTGDLLIGKTLTDNTTSGLRLAPDFASFTRSGNVALILDRLASDGNIALFRRSNTEVGSISVTTTATAYNTSSDYRLKENVVPLIGAADRVNQLQVHRFNFITDPDKTVDGFLAHEAQAVVPECVTGTKDEVDDEGNPVYQGIDQSKLVPLLTAALQEALAEIESLKARVTALEP